MKIPLRPIGRALLWLLDKAFGTALLVDELAERRKQRARTARDLLDAQERRSAKTVKLDRKDGER